MPERWRLLVELASWCGIHRGELLALRREDLDLMRGAVRVERTAHQMQDGSIIVGEPKTEAGRRSVRWPPHLTPSIEHHLATYVGAEPKAELVGERHHRHTQRMAPADLSQ